jgi:hypothetical protein
MERFKPLAYIFFSILLAASIAFAGCMMKRVEKAPYTLPESLKARIIIDEDAELEIWSVSEEEADDYVALGDAALKRSDYKGALINYITAVYGKRGLKKDPVFMKKLKIAARKSGLCHRCRRLGVIK